jgi:hypothetical protein
MPGLELPDYSIGVDVDSKQWDITGAYFDKHAAGNRVGASPSAVVAGSAAGRDSYIDIQ